jgi:hypothetical protein
MFRTNLLPPSSGYILEAVGPSEAFNTSSITRHINTGNQHRNIQCHEDLKFHVPQLSAGATECYSLRLEDGGSKGLRIVDSTPTHAQDSQQIFRYDIAILNFF